MRPRQRIGLWIGAFRLASRNENLRRVELARLASVTGRWAYTVTLAVYAYRASGTTGVALVGIVRLVPAGVVAPFAGALVRHARLEPLLWRSGLLRSAALAGAGLTVVLHGPAAAVYGCAAIESAVSSLMRPVQNSLLPALSRTPEELTSANLALSVIESGGVFLGPLLGAGLLQVTSIGIVLLASAAAYLVSAIVLLSVRVPSEPVTRGRATGFLLDAAAGAQAVAADRDVRIVVLLYGAQNLVAGAVNVLIVVAAFVMLGMGESGVGALTAALGAGGVVGGAVVSARLRSGRHGADLELGLLLWGLPLVALSLVSSDVLALLLLGIVGIGVTSVDVSASTLLQRSVTRELLPHALAILQTMFVVSVGLGTLLAPFLVSLVGVRGALLGTGALLPVLALGAWPRLRMIDARPLAHPELVKLLGGIPIFAPLSDASLEYLAASSSGVDVPARTVVVEQGDPGDAFYVIQAGVADVVIDGERVRTLGPGDYFGEIALLRDSPRTATILAREDMRLVRLESGVFISTVTANAASSESAEAVIGARLGGGVLATA